MQKKLIAVAVAGLLAAPAFAQTHVTIYGRGDIGVFNRDADSGDSRTTVDSSGWTTSRLGFKGSEDLGNGLKAVFQFEYRLNVDGNSKDSAALSGSEGIGAARDNFVGLGGDWGTVVAGRLSTPLNNWLGSYDPTGQANFFKVNTVNTEYHAETRLNNAFAYVSPNWGGFELAAMYAMDEIVQPNGDTNENDAYGIGLQYKGGGFGAMYQFAAVTDVVDTHTVGLFYDFGVAKVTGTYFYHDIDDAVVRNAEEETAYSLGLAVPVGNGVISAGWGQEKDVGGLADNDYNIYSIAYKHNLSKRTYLYAGFQRNEHDVRNGEEQDTFGVGVAHHF